MNKFLVAHFDNNPDYYDRSRSKGHPVYSIDVNDHGTIRTINFFAKVEKPAGGGGAVVVDFSSHQDLDQRFLAWWRLGHGDESITANTQLPPNLLVNVPNVTLQIDIPKLDGSAGTDGIDFPFSVSASVFVTLATEGPDNVLKFTDWDIQVNPVGDPLLPGDPRWGPTKSGCEDELKRLREFLANAFKLGANVALTELSHTLIRTLPFPPVDVVNNVSVKVRELYLQDSVLAVTADVAYNNFADRLAQKHAYILQKFIGKVGQTDLETVFYKAPENRSEREEYLQQNIPAYRELVEEIDRLSTPLADRKPRPLVLDAFPSNDLFIFLSPHVFDVLAKEILKASQADCTDWWKPVDILVGYARGRACYWIRLTNAFGNLNGTTISMGCNTDMGGNLDLQACIRIPCAPDQCETWSPGFGLAGALNVSITFSASGWDDNKALRLSGNIDHSRGFEVYGLPPVVGDVANAILNFLSSVILQTFFNALLSMVNFYLISINAKIPNANVDVEIHELGVQNLSGYLVVTGTTTFE